MRLRLATTHHRKRTIQQRPSHPQPNPNQYPQPQLQPQPQPKPQPKPQPCPSYRSNGSIVAQRRNLLSSPQQNSSSSIAAPPIKLLLAAFLLLSATAHAQDTDRDGLSDTFEQAILDRFQPTFLIAQHDCSNQPAHFREDLATPTVATEDGTVYGQAFPRATGEIELHFYHLWRTDCGRMGHPLDTEHVSALLRGTGTDPAHWTAVYWYAAAHEDTVCDASQVTRATTLDAETHGPRIWVSNGKHASFLAETLCTHGCGGDRCTSMQPLEPQTTVNLGEAASPMHGSIFIASSRWPLAQKMTRTDFKPATLQRLEALPATDIAWAEPAKRPGQAAILGANRTVDGSLAGGSAGAHGAVTGAHSTDTALTVTAAKTGSALHRTYRNVRHALGTAGRDTVHAVEPASSAPAPSPSMPSPPAKAEPR